jgi:hydrogenase maturation protease
MSLKSTRLLILGLGNEILGDDAIGLLVSKRVFEILRSSLHDVDVSYAAAQVGGWRLLDLLPGYDEIVIVDAIQGGGKVGECYRVNLGESSTSHLKSSHGLGLEEALTLAFPVGEGPRPIITVYGIECRNVLDLGEGLSPSLVDKIEPISSEIAQDVESARIIRLIPKRAA